MNAVARIWWTFFTAVPLQRWLAVSGVVLAGSLAIVGLVLREPLFGVVFSSLAFFILVVFPALFTSAAVVRGLSAPRVNRFLPHFRGRMLTAILALEAAAFGLFALLLFALMWFSGRTVPLEPLIYAFAVGTVTFMLMFGLFGDYRWMWLTLGLAVAFIALGRSAPQALAAIPPLGWLIAAVGAWVAFGRYYLRARHIKPLSLVPQPPSLRSSGSWVGEAVTRERALRVLVNAQLPWSHPRLFSGIVGIVVAVVILTVLASNGRYVPFTSFIWPLATVVVLWGKTTAIVQRSRMLWLRVPGTRDVVRREIERELLRNLGGAGLLLLGGAVVYSSPLLSAPPSEALAGLALSICAGLFGTYAALAAVPGKLLQLASFAVLMVAQLGLLSRPSPALPDVVIISAIELAAAIAFRAIAVARWRRVDWLRLRPLPLTNMFRNA